MRMDILDVISLAKKGHIEVAKQLLENKADINEIFATTVGAITTSLTLILLIQQLTP